MILLGSLYFIANVNIWPIFWWFIAFFVPAFRLRKGFGLDLLIWAWTLWYAGLLVIKWRLDVDLSWDPWLWLVGARQSFDYSPIFREGASDLERYKTVIRFLVENNFDVTERPPVQNESKVQKGSLIN